MFNWWGVSYKPNRVCPRSGDGDEWRSTLDDISQREEGRGAILLLFLDRQTCQVASPSSQGCQIGQLNRIPACRWSSRPSYPAAKSVIKTLDTHNMQWGEQALTRAGKDREDPPLRSVPWCVSRCEEARKKVHNEYETLIPHREKQKKNSTIPTVLKIWNCSML